ncbi:hypothetical protein [Mycobacterium sp. AT1]|uniref:hypothetical protein n=1 Tax=Mycobacterium sp. AT1 TaxID=1961706 RepID=UPI001301D329|nr:hypothetical protein [Mycobacterium sp. AT1]
MTAPTEPAELSPEGAAWVRRVVDAAPPLSDEQRTRLAELLRPARAAGADGGSS